MYSPYYTMKFLFHMLHIFQNGPATILPSSKLSFIRVHHSLGKSATNTLISSLSLAAYREFCPTPHLPTVLTSFLSKFTALII